MRPTAAPHDPASSPARGSLSTKCKWSVRLSAYRVYAKDGRCRKIRTTTPEVSGPPLPGLLNRSFVDAPGEQACGDITYHQTDEG
jgi:hypothetical protein